LAYIQAFFALSVLALLGVVFSVSIQQLDWAETSALIMVGSLFVALTIGVIQSIYRRLGP